MLNLYLTFLALGFHLFLQVEAQVGTEKLIEYPNYGNHQCTRYCDGIVRDCYYEMTLEWMYSMEPTCGNCLTGNPDDCSNPTCIVADGLPRILMAYNRQLPGPTIQVCQGDTIIFDLHNDLVDVDTVIHWHGQDNMNNNHMDGVPFITQCPIHSGTTFRYNLRAMQSGTHWAHSHRGFQRDTGAFFPLIVRVPAVANPFIALYNFDLAEHIITVTEWSSVLPLINNYRINRMRISDQFLTSILVNGRGANDTNAVPPTIFIVNRGYKFRFRLIGAGARICPIEMKIDGHRMKIISTDGHDIEPIDVDTLVISPGERIDFILYANLTTMIYTMQFRGLMDCEGITGRALLRYAGATTTFRPTTTGNGRVFNCINTPSNTSNCVNYDEVRSLDALEYPLTNTFPTYKYFFQTDIYDYALPKFQGVRNNEITTSTFNNINFQFPSTPMIQTAPPNTCNYETTGACRQANRVCVCTHMLEIRLNEMVEMIFVDEGSVYNLSHPIHLHGKSFRVIGQDQLGSQTTTIDVRNRDVRGLLKRNLNRPVIKDTIAVPDGGYVIIRFLANNPGYWFLHCHVEHHAEEGMAVVLKVGNPSAAPANFPRCGNTLG